MSNNSAPVSVVIPVYNRLQYLGETLTSVFAQSARPTEVILVDDCSTESLQDYLSGSGYSASVNVVRTDRTRGVAAARNWGWRHARNPYIAFNDSDDIWLPEKLEFQLNYLRQHPDVDGIYTALTAFFPDGTELPWAHDRPTRVTVESALADANLCIQSFLVKRSVLEAIGGFDESFGILDDQDIAIRLALHGAEIHFVQTPALTRLRRNSYNYSSRAVVYFKDDVKVLRKHRRLCEEVYGPGSHRVHLARAIVRLSSRVRFTGKLGRVAAFALCASAPKSTMPPPGEGW